MAEFTLKARPLAFHASCDKPYLNASCKVIIPQSILQTLMDMSGNTIHSPIAFLLSQGDREIISVGVEEFSAPEGFIYLPSFIMETYWIPYETEVTLRYQRVEKGTKISIKPHTTAFIDGKAKEKTFLENYLKKCYPVLRAGSTILIEDEGVEYYINIAETEPEIMISTIDTDLEVEFKEPLDYVEPPPPPPPSIVEDMVMPKNRFVPFAGKGYRLGGNN